MIFDPIKLSKLLVHFDLTPNQFFAVYMVWKDRHEFLADVISRQEAFVVTDLQKLVRLGYFEPYEPETNFSSGDMRFNIDLHELRVTPKFTQSLFIEDDVAGRELFDAYPQFILINNQRVVAKSCNKDEYMKRYGMKIGYDAVMHAGVLKSLEWAKTKNLVNFSIKNFIDGEMWDSFDPDGEASGRLTNNTFR